MGKEKGLKEWEEAIINGFMDHPKVKSIAEERRIIFIPKINLLCELESNIANKIIVEAIFEDFLSAIEMLHSLSNKIIERGLAKSIIDYGRGRSVEDLKVGDVDVWKDKVFI